jgi:hypothetical protein
MQAGIGSHPVALLQAQQVAAAHLLLRHRELHTGPEQMHMGGSQPGQGLQGPLAAVLLASAGSPRPR